jgi:hypothetical protein
MVIKGLCEENDCKTVISSSVCPEHCVYDSGEVGCVYDTCAEYTNFPTDRCGVSDGCVYEEGYCKTGDCDDVMSLLDCEESDGCIVQSDKCVTDSCREQKPISDICSFPCYLRNDRQCVYDKCQFQTVSESCLRNDGCMFYNSMCVDENLRFFYFFYFFICTRVHKVSVGSIGSVDTTNCGFNGYPDCATINYVVEYRFFFFFFLMVLKILQVEQIFLIAANNNFPG